MTDQSGDERSEMDLDEAAATWFQRLHDPDASPDTIAAFERWRDAAHAHAEAFERIGRLWEAVGEHASSPEMLQFREAALADARSGERPSRVLWYAAAASAGILSVVAIAFYLLQPASTLTYATQVGERRALILTDNSHVDVDAESTVSVEYSKGVRLVRVERGQAYFQVAKDRARPFVVESNGRKVIATGTEFNVEAIPEGLRVTLVEGHVVVRTADAPGAGGKLLAALSPGDELTISQSVTPKLVHGANILALTAWKQGKLVFDDTPLADALVQMARYSRFQLATDPSIEDIKVSGVFNEGDLGGFVGALESYYGVKVVAGPQGSRKLTRRP